MKKVKLPKWLYTIFGVKVRYFTYSKTPYMGGIIDNIEKTEGKDSPKIIAIYKGSAVGCSVSTANSIKEWAENSESNVPQQVNISNNT